MLHHDGIIEKVFQQEGNTLTVDIFPEKVAKTITISDNSIGMNGETLIAFLKIATPTADRRSKYGMLIAR